jgi:hypothetical protein
MAGKNQTQKTVPKKKLETAKPSGTREALFSM